MNLLSKPKEIKKQGQSKGFFLGTVVIGSFGLFLLSVYNIIVVIDNTFCMGNLS